MSNLEKIEIQIKDALMEVSVAQREFEQRTSECRAANRAQTEATNRLNAAQKTVDTLMQKMKSSCGGDWGSSKGTSD